MKITCILRTLSVSILLIVSICFSGAAQEHAGKFFERELVFGGKRISGDFRLSQTIDLVVDQAGNIILADANMIKIFTGRGDPVTIIRSGKMFSVLMELHIAPSGYLTVQTVNGFSLFSPDLEFCGKTSFIAGPAYINLMKQLKLHMAMPRRIIALNENERLFSGEAGERSLDGSEVFSNVLVYDQNDTLRTLARYEIANKVWTGKQSHTVPLLGDFHWVLLPDQRVVYTHTSYDRREDRDSGEYILHIKGIGQVVPDDYVISYDPVEFPDSLIDRPGPGLYQVDMEIEDVRKIFREKYLEAKYYPPVRSMIAGGSYIYVVHYRQTNKGEPLVDIINIDSGKCVNSLYFPFEPAFIRNGRFYSIKWEEQQVPEIEIYRVAPELYGRNY